MAEKVSNMLLLFAAFSSLAMISTIEANMVFYDGFTIEMPVWFELIPRLRPPYLAPFKESAGHPNAIPNNNDLGIHGRPPFQVQPDRVPQMEYNHPGYPNIVHIQPKPLQHPLVHPQHPAAPPQYPTAPPQYPEAQPQYPPARPQYPAAPPQYPRTQEVYGPVYGPAMPPKYPVKFPDYIPSTTTTTTTEVIPPAFGEEEGHEDEYPQDVGESDESE